MNGKFFYFAVAALFGVISSYYQFLPIFFLTIGYFFILFRFKKYTYLQIGIVFTTYLLFLLSGYHAKIETKSAIPETTSGFYFQYNEIRKIDGDLLQVIAVDTRYNEKVMLRYEIQSKEEKTALKNENFYGRLCYVSGQLSKPAFAKNPNAFDYQKYLASKQIYWILETPQNPIARCTLIKTSPVTMLKELRFYGIHYLERHFPPEIASLSAALIYGDRSLFDPDVLTDYQKTGIVHLLAISGLHVSLLIGMVFYLGIRFGVTRQIMTNLLLAILPIYAIITGASPSVIRACLMIFLVLLTLKWKRQLKLLPIDAISIALMIYMIIAPKIIFDAGFQLSFVVSFAIIISSSIIHHRCQKLIQQMLSISFISQFSAMPILLYHFFEISFISIVANLLYIPLFSFIFLPGLYVLYFIELLFGTTPSLLVNFFMKMILMANQFIDFLADISFAQFVPGRPNGIFLIFYVFIILMIFFIWERRPYKNKQLHLMLLVIMIFLFQSIWNQLKPYGEVTMIDVGQGDSILIQLPFGKGTYLIDTGGTMQFHEEEWRRRAKPFEVGRDVVVPFLKGKGITEIDKLILTHGDTDHIGGAFSVINELKVKHILLPDVSETSESELKIIQEANKKGIGIVKISEGNQWRNGKNHFFVLSPVKNYTGERNGGSIAVYARIGGLNWFFGGDLDMEGEEKIIRKYPNLSIDVLKAGHHGSKTSTSEQFVSSSKPKVALISVGERNRYGHPHKEVLERLENSIIYRTNVHGAITYRFSQEQGTFSPFLHKIKQ